MTEAWTRTRWGRLWYRLPAAADRTLRRSAPTPRVVMLGHQKTGTTAIAAGLAASCGLGVTLDLWREVRNPRAYRPWGPADLDRLVDHNHFDFAQPVVKDPNLTLFAEAIRQRWPAVPVVLVVRDPLDTVRSVLDRLGMEPGHTWSSTDSANLPAGWAPTFDPATAGLTTAEAMPLSVAEYVGVRWERFAGAIRGLDGPTAVVRYEDFVADRAGEIARLARAVDLRADHGADLERQYQGRGTRRDEAAVDVLGVDVADAVRRRTETGAALHGYGDE